MSLAASTAAFAQSGVDPQGRSGDRSAEAGVVVPIVKQDQSDCTNGDVSDRDPSLVGGSARVVRGSDGNTTVTVAITAQPNTTYQFFLKCVRQLGEIKTYDEGEGNGTFQFPSNAAGASFAFDMYPAGAAPGSKYQSMTVKAP